MEFKRAILTGATKDLNRFIKEWYKDEDKEAPTIDEEMDITLNVKEEHIAPLMAMADHFHLMTYILD